MSTLPFVLLKIHVYMNVTAATQTDAGLGGLLYRKEVRVCAHVCRVGLQRLHILDQLPLLLWCQIRPKVMTGVGIPL